MIFAYGTSTLYGRLFNTILLIFRFITPITGPTTPVQQARPVWAVPRSLATTNGIISFPLGTKMFQFPRFPSLYLYIQWRDDAGSRRRVSPFGHPRIVACTRLPEAYRSVPRPSSALGTKASTIRS